MDTKKLQERIAKCEAKIEKLENTLSKHLVKLQKIYQKYAEAKELHTLLPLDLFIKFDTETYYTWKEEIEIEKEIGLHAGIHNKEAVKYFMKDVLKIPVDYRLSIHDFLYNAEQVVNTIINKRKEIKEVNEQLSKYKSELLIQDNKRDAVENLFKQVPMLKTFIEDCGEKQYAFLINHNKAIKEAWNKYYKLDREACELWNTGKHDEYKIKEKEAKAIRPKVPVRTEEQIRNDVERWKANESQLMADRIKTEFGDIISTDLYLSPDGNVNGIIRGANKTARIETIFAGGYNIQCLHTRMLIHEK